MCLPQSCIILRFISESEEGIANRSVTRGKPAYPSCALTSLLGSRSVALESGDMLGLEMVTAMDESET